MSLATVLAELYSDPESIRRLATEAGIDVARINLAQPAVNAWPHVIQEADRQTRMAALAAIALREYPTYAPLQLALAETSPAAVTPDPLPVRVGRLEQRVDGHDTLLRRVLAEVDPGPRRRTARAAISVAIVCYLMSLAVLETRVWYLANPVQAILVLAAVVLFVIIVRYVSEPDDGTS